MLRSACLLALSLASFAPSAHAQVIRAVNGPGGYMTGPIVIRSGPTAVTPVTGAYPPRAYFPGNPYYNDYNRFNNYYRPGGFVPYYGFGGGWDGPQTTVINNTIINNPAPVVIVAAPVRNTGRVTIHVPKDALVYVHGDKLDQSGSVRVIETPLLIGEQTHVLKLRITWEQGGKTQEESREMELRTGDSKSWTILTGE